MVPPAAAAAACLGRCQAPVPRRGPSISMVEEADVIIASFRETLDKEEMKEEKEEEEKEEEMEGEEEEEEGGKDAAAVAADFMVEGPYPSSFAAGRDCRGEEDGEEDNEARRACCGEEDLSKSSPLLSPSLPPSPSSSPLSTRGAFGGNT